MMTFKGASRFLLNSVPFLLGPVLLLSGCTTAPPPNVGTSAGGKIVVKGISAYWPERDGQPAAAVLWTDSPSDRGAGGSSDGTRTEHRRTLVGANGREFSWECKTPDGKTGTLIIDGTPYDLDKGWLFIVSTKEPQIQVTQLSRELSKFPRSGAAVESLTTDDSDVAAFIAKAGKP